MEYESAHEAAERLKVTPRAVQKWAAGGKIPGAKRIGRTWAIPRSWSLSETVSDKEAEAPQSAQTLSQHAPLPLLSSAFPIGGALEFIDSLTDADDRAIATAEYYYYTGQPEKAADLAALYLENADMALRFSAGFVCTFANLSCGRAHLTKFAIESVLTELKRKLQFDPDSRKYAIGVLTAVTGSVLLHISVPEIPPLQEYIRYLPGGLKLWACYVLAYRAMKEGKADTALSIVDIALAVKTEDYPVAEVYCRMVEAAALMQKKYIDEARACLLRAWKFAKADGWIMPFGSHQSLLHGIPEMTIKQEFPNDYKRIHDIGARFNAGWRQLRNADHDLTTARLTHMEFVVAMLVARGWTMREIAAHLQISERTVGNYMATVYSTLGINNRKGLTQYMER